MCNDTIIHVHGFAFFEYEGDVHISEEDVREVAFLPIPMAREKMAIIPDEGRLDPIFHVLDHVYATGTRDVFECTYHVTEDGAIVHRERGKAA